MLKQELEKIVTKTYKTLKRSARELTFLTLFGLSAHYLKAQDWESEIIDYEAIPQTSIVVDNNGDRHIAYQEFKEEIGGRELRYIFYSELFDWLRTEFTTNLGAFGGNPDIDFDSNNMPHIPYYDHLSGEILQKVKTEYWSVRFVDEIGQQQIGAFPKSVIDRKGTPEDDKEYITYFDCTGGAKLKLATFNGEDFDVETVVDLDNLIYTYLDMTKDQNGNLYIIYEVPSQQGGHGLSVITKTGSSWSEPTNIIESGSIGYVSIICDSNNIPHALFRQGESLVHAYLDGTNWKLEEVIKEGEGLDLMGLYSSIASDNFSNLFAAFWNGQSGLEAEALMYTFRNNGKWTTPETVNPTAGRGVSLFIQNNQPHISSINTTLDGEEFNFDLNYSTRGTTDIKGNDKTPKIPKDFNLSQNYPNPFNPNTTISYSIPQEYNSNVSLNIYDVRGRLVKTLEDSIKEPGSYSVNWNGTDNNNNKVNSGVYLYTITLNDKKETKKMLLLK